MADFIDPVARKRALIEARKREAAAASEKEGLLKKDALVQYTPPKDAKNRIRIIFDDSGSMIAALKVKDTFSSRIIEARKGVIEFLRNCKLNEDAVAVHALNVNPEYTSRGVGSAIAKVVSTTTLTTDLTSLAAAVDEIEATGGTPLYEEILTALNDSPQATRLVAFSDGEAYGRNVGEVIEVANSKKIPIDTVFFGESNSNAAMQMKYLADKTGGIFLAFDPEKGVSFADAFKYLSPGKRLMLMNAEFKAKVERGEV